MSGANKLLFVLAASSGVVSSGQFLKPIETSSFTGSWMSSSYWAPGRDGQMHQRVHEVRSETFHDHGVPVKHTESETACKDGLCQQTVSIEKPGSITVISQQAEGRWSQSIGMPTRLRNMLRGLSLPIVIVDDREAPVNLKKFLAPRPKPAMDRMAVAPGAEDITESAFVPLFALGGVGISLAALTVTAMAQCLRSDSREVPLRRSLGEPLAPAEEARVARCSAKAGRSKHKKARAAPEAMPVGAYLDRLYARAVVTTETAAAKTYLYRVYEQATA